MPQLLRLTDENGYKPTLLVTSGILCQDPLPDLFSLASCRAAQFNILSSCAKAFGAQGVHCGVIDIQNHFGEDGPVCDARAVAEQAWELYSEYNGAGYVVRPVVN
jgi:hypothetical protein